MTTTPHAKGHPTLPRTGAAASVAPERDLLSMRDFGADLLPVLEAARALKAANKSGHPTPYLAGKSGLLIFEKSSTRTRVSFEIGLAKLGATATFLSTRDIQMGRGESIEDTALVLSRYADVLVYRAYRAEDVRDLARHGTIPVVNALDDMEHPCQIAADWLTLLEHKGRLEGLRFAYVGDGNNVCHSYLLGGAMAGMHVVVATPPGYEPATAYVEGAQRIAKATGGSIALTHDFESVFTDDLDAIATDTWVSMGDEDEKETRLKAFAGFTVTEEHMARSPDAVFLHCLPAYYGYEVTKEVAHGPRSVVFDEAENRMWAQMAILLWLLQPWRVHALATKGVE